MNPIKSLILSSVGALGYDIVKRAPVAPPPPSDGDIQKAAAESSYIWAHIAYDPTRVPIEAYHRLYSAESLERKRFYNIGAGSFRHPMWTNVDMRSEWYAKDQSGTELIEFDLMTLGRLPIEDGCAECVYISHTLEHVSDAAGANAMKEAHRILKPGGIIRITGPDVSRDIEAMRRGDRDHFYYLGLYSHPDVVKRVDLDPTRSFNTASLQQIILFGVASSTSQFVNAKQAAKISDEEFDHLFATLGEEKALDAICAKADYDVQKRCPGYHVSWWSVTKAMRMLRQAGFNKVYQSGYGQSIATVMTDVVLFDQQDPKLSFYVEAEKS